ncbi:MAG: redoxin domain-containing protein [Planctomycetaceae bacterium]
MKNVKQWDRRLLILFAAGVLIFGASYYKFVQQQQRAMTSEAPISSAARKESRPAPLFEAFNQDNQIVRLSPFIGRHEIWVVFFHEPLNRDPLFQAVLNVADDVQSSGIKIIGVTPELPQNNRKFLETIEETTIPILTDPEPIYSLHEQWGLVDRNSGDVRSALFVIDRLGNVSWGKGHPVPISDVAKLLNEYSRD